MKILNKSKNTKMFFFIFFIIIILSSFASLYLIFKYQDIRTFKIHFIEYQKSINDNFVSYFILDDSINTKKELEKTYNTFKHNLNVMQSGGNIVSEINDLDSEYFKPIVDYKVNEILNNIENNLKEIKSIIFNNEKNNLAFLIHKTDNVRNDLNSIIKIFKNNFETIFYNMLILLLIISLSALFIVLIIFSNYSKLANAEKIISNYIEFEKLSKQDNKIQKAELNELQRSNKDLESFAYIAAHDLKEPLRMVTSYAELLREKYISKLDEKADKYIQYIMDGSKIMFRLMEDLLAYSCVKTHDYKFELIDLEKIINNVKNNLEMVIIDSGAEIKVGKMPKIYADKTQFVEVFQNLINNAIKYKRQEKIIIEINVESFSDNYLFSVKDNGIGIEKKFFDRIFIIFQRLHKKHVYSGSGIGLAIVKSIIEKHAGKIWVESEINKGSTFYFTIPKNIKLG